MRVLIVEDDAELAQALALGLRDEGFAVDLAATGTDGLHEAEGGEHDLVILDWMLPGLDGAALLGRLRRGGSLVPVLLLTARGALEDRVRGLGLGADDYLVKPFDFEELLARIRALLRRTARVARNQITWRELCLDLDERRVRWAGVEIGLTPRELGILETLLARRGQAVSRTRLIESVYDSAAEPDSNVIDAHIANLRRKLRLASGFEIIETVRGAGFRIPAEPKR